MLVARGGRGGMGNARFATSTNRAPRKVQPGEPGEEKDLRLELKLLADVGLVGFPERRQVDAHRARLGRPSEDRRLPVHDADARISASCGLSDDRSFVVADVPGLIEGAHRGLGLGHQFLRHLERTKVLVHLVDVPGATGRDPVDDLDTLRRELRALRRRRSRPSRRSSPRTRSMRRTRSRTRRGSPRSNGAPRSWACPFFRISGVTGAGVPELLEAMWQRLAASRQSAA